VTDIPIIGFREYCEKLSFPLDLKQYTVEISPVRQIHLK
jgi:hypothetical protein